MKVLQDYLKIQNVQMQTQTVDRDDNAYHSHVFYEIFFICSGTIEHKVNGETSTLSVGDICFMRPGDSHTFLRSPDNLCEHRDILISTSLFKSACDYLSPSFFDEIHSAKQPHIFRLSQSEFNALENDYIMFSNMVITSPNDDLLPTENFLAIKLLYILLTRLRSQTSSNYPQWLKDLLLALNDKDNFTKSLNEITSSLHFNHSYLSRTFTKFIGTTMAKYFINSRLAYSVRLLQFTQMSIAQIAIESGFPTITYYNRCFKAAFGISPSNYRRNSTSNIGTK